MYLSEIFAKHGQDYYLSTKEIRYTNIVSEAMRSDKNILIGNAFWNLDDVLQIEKLLNEKGIGMNAIFVPSIKRRKDLINKQLDLIEKHLPKGLGRWVDHPDWELLEKYNKFDKMLNELRAGLEIKKIMICEI